jgi:hypothetical protein
MRDKRLRGPWRQDDLEPRIVLDGEGEFFAIAVSAAGAAWIVAALNAEEPVRGPERLPGGFEAASRSRIGPTDH